MAAPARRITGALTQLNRSWCNRAMPSRPDSMDDPSSFRRSNQLRQTASPSSQILPRQQGNAAPRPGTPAALPMVEWVAHIRLLFQTKSAPRIDGRHPLLGLALIDRRVYSQLSQLGILTNLIAE